MGCPGVLPSFLDNFGHDRYGDLVKVINQMPFLAALAALYIGIPAFVSKFTDGLLSRAIDAAMPEHLVK